VRTFPLIALALLAGCAGTNPPAKQTPNPAPPLASLGVPCVRWAKPVGHKGEPLDLPTAAKRQGSTEGWVIVRQDISNGGASNVGVVVSSDPVYDSAALSAAKNLVYPREAVATQCLTQFGFSFQ
jgi:hypothetical protein